MRTDKAWVIQCALSRICGFCTESLGRPIAFVGTREEIARNAFHVPPMHQSCAQELMRGPEADRDWRIVLTSGFEFVRPAREDADRRPTYQPNSLLPS